LFLRLAAWDGGSRLSSGAAHGARVHGARVHRPFAVEPRQIVCGGMWASIYTNIIMHQSLDFTLMLHLI
jgi:hypothetical protein